ncbi:hypothetical protein ABIC90_002514, partial [Variovorax boronicumulans]
GGETRTVTGGATETVSSGETRTITGGAVETISGGETRLVNGGIVETDNGDVFLMVNGSTVRLVSGADIRITAAGRLEIVNAFDGKLVLGPQSTTVTGTKTVSAPSMVYNSTNYTINTVNYTLNANVAVINTPGYTGNAADQGWVDQQKDIVSNRRVRLFIAAADFFGIKAQVSVVNTMLSGVFANWSYLFWLDAIFNIKVNVKSRVKAGTVQKKGPFVLTVNLKRNKR